MKVYYQHISNGTGLSITDPINAYIGQTITIHNKSGSTIYLYPFISGSSIQGQQGNTFQNIATTTTNGYSHAIHNNVIRTYMFIGSTANPRWIVLGC